MYLPRKPVKEIKASSKNVKRTFKVKEKRALIHFYGNEALNS